MLSLVGRLLSLEALPGFDKFELLEQVRPRACPPALQTWRT